MVSENGLIEVEINKTLSKSSQNVGFLYKLLKDRNVPK